MISGKVGARRRGVVDRGANGLGVEQRVEVQRALLGGSELFPERPLGGELGHGVRLHQRGEGLVEPNVVPPDHGHQIAEPLVRQLVRHDAIHALARVDRAVLRIDQQRGVAEEDRAGVLHTAGLELRYGDEVELRVGIGHAEPLLIPGHGVYGRLQREAAEGPLPHAGEDAHRHVADEALEHIEAADRQGDEVGGERERHRKVPGLVRPELGIERRLLRVVMGGQGVRDHHLLARRGNGEGEGGLHRRLVEAGKGLARVDGLELGEGLGLAVAGLRQVEAAQVMAQRRLEGQLQRRRPRLELLGQLEGDRLRRGVGARGQGQRCRRPG